MVQPDQVAQLALALPEVTEGERHGNRTWFVRGKGFCWERPLSKADVKRWGDGPPPIGPIVALSKEDMAEKAAVLAAGTRGVFDMQHFHGYPAVLVDLSIATLPSVRRLVLDAWLAHAPEDVARAHLATLSGRSSRRRR